MGTSEQKSTTIDKRAEIIRGAFAVFYQEGFHASGVDSLLEGTGISKRTLYKYFVSKEDLIAATLHYYSERIRERIQSFVEESGAKTGSEKILAMFDWVGSVIESGHKTGCFAINAKLEYVGRNAEIEKACDQFFAGGENRFFELCREDRCKDSKKLAKQLHILFQGAIVNGQVTQDGSPAQLAKATAKLLLEKALR